MVVKIVMIGTILWTVGFIMIMSVVYMEFLGSYMDVADSVSSRNLMTLKLGGVGFTLAGIFWALIAIVKVLKVMPDNLAKVIKM